MEKFRNAYRVLGERPDGKRSLGMPRLRCEDNIKTDLREVVCDAQKLDRTCSRQGPKVGLYKGCNEPPGSLKADKSIIILVKIHCRP